MPGTTRALASAVAQALGELDEYLKGLPSLQAKYAPDKFLLPRDGYVCVCARVVALQLLARINLRINGASRCRAGCKSPTASASTRRT